MKRIYLLLIVLLSSSLSYANNDFIWGQTGHRVVGEIASNHLTKRAKKNLMKLLDCEGLAMISTFADEIKSDRKYDPYKPWHYVNWKEGETYKTSTKNPKGDLITGIETCKNKILDDNTTKEEKVFYLKLLVHLVGDLHQPLHVGRAEDRGGNAIRVKWFRGNSNLHSVWDTKMIESFNMTYTELSENLDILSKKEVKSLQKGNVLDWVAETRILTMQIYASAEKNDNLSYRYMYDYFDTVKTQLQKGGLRLAKVLNELFG